MATVLEKQAKEIRILQALVLMVLCTTEWVEGRLTFNSDEIYVRNDPYPLKGQLCISCQSFSEKVAHCINLIFLILYI